MPKFVRTVVILFCAIAASTAQDVQNAAKSATPEPQTAQSANADANDPREELAKMRTLLGQMQRNVAFVSAGDTPLKHQFELEIEMWQLVLRDMEKKLNSRHTVPAK